VGDAQRIPYGQLLEEAYERFESADDFTLAVEEEFALVDPATLDLVNRFEDVQDAARGTELEPHLAGELIASEVEVKTGRCERFADAASLLVVRREQLRGLVEQLGLGLGATGTHPWASWKDQRLIDTPHYRRNNEILQYVVWRNNTFGFHVHVAIRGADRAIAVTNALRSYLPELLAVSSSSPLVEGVNSGLHSARTQIFTRFFPRCGVPDAFASWDEFSRFVTFLYETRSIDENTQLWWSIRAHLAFPTVEIRICDGQPDPGDAQALTALCLSLTARIARAYDEGEELVFHPHRLIEENLWRAIRYGLSGELIDFATGDVIPARARAEQLIEWVLPVAEEIGAAAALRVPAVTSAERQIALHEQGVGLPEIYAAENALSFAPRAVSPST
jgi:carboxylate-amine ligase